MPARRIALIVGSLRKDAFSGRAALAMKSMAPPTLSLEDVAIGGLPFYNQDLETDNPPAPWVEFRNAIRSADAILFVTPEYNRGLPAALKNAVDVGSRPYGKSVWDEKPVGIVSTSPGPLGGFGANHQLRQNLSFFNMRLIQQPEMYLTFVNKSIEEGGKVTDDPLRGQIEKYLAAYATWVERCLIKSPG